MSADFLVLFYTTSAGEQYRKLNIDASFSIKVTKITLSLYITIHNFRLSKYFHIYNLM